MISRNFLINAAKEVGFDLVGVVRAEHLEAEHNIFNKWLLDSNQSSLSYLERNIEKRFDARLLAEGAQSVVICAVSYLSTISRGYNDNASPKIASYALNRDYHTTIKEMLTELAAKLKEKAPELKFRAFTDSAPLAEKSHAARAGLGWIGRNSLLITKQHGSFIHLGELVIDQAFDSYDTPINSPDCGSCRRCIDACPNSAILDNRTIDTRRCISCRTIEREQPSEIGLHGWVFGCDLCQSVCPFNSHAPLHSNHSFDPLFDPTKISHKQWLAMSDSEFDSLAGTTPMTRSGLERIKQNIINNIEQEHTSSKD